MAKAQGILKNFIDKVKLERSLTDALEQDLKNVALETESAIKDNTPTVSGDLKNSMTARRLAFLEYEVATNIEYAAYVEYGNEGFNVSFTPRAMMRRGAAQVEEKGLQLFVNVNKFKI